MLPHFPRIEKILGTIEDINIKMLLVEYGSPLFVISERIISERCQEFQKALQHYYPNSHIAYSVKTNYLPGVLQVMKRFGLWAEVVSGFEYWIARKIGFKPHEIIFNGPDKKTEDLVRAAREGVTINADNQSDIERLGHLTKKSNQVIRMGIRVNTKIGDIFWNRFGFNLESGEAYLMIKQTKKLFPRLVVDGLHIHISSNVNQSQYYEEAAEKVSDFAIKIQKDFAINTRYLDLGGGFAVPGSRWQNNPIWVVPTIDEYIINIAKAIKTKMKENQVTLILEPGRFLIDEAGIFATTVINTKKASDIQLINVDSSSHSHLKSVYRRHNIIEAITPEKSSHQHSMITHIAGNSCIGYDFLAWESSLPKLSVGDVLLFYNAGAYTVSRTEQFIHPRPAVVIIREDASVNCIRRKERYEDLVHLDKNFIS